jgi:hypothetical protein
MMKILKSLIFTFLFANQVSALNFKVSATNKTTNVLSKYAEKSV